MSSRNPRLRGMITAGLAVAVVGGAVAIPAQGALSRPTDSSSGRVGIRMVGGEFPNQPDGAVSLYAPSYNGFSCSASRIGPQWVLTARHCAELNPTKVFTNSITKVSGDSAQVTNIYLAPNGDVALLKLASSPAGKILPYASKPLQQGASVLMRGWGMDSPSGTSTNRLKSASGTFVGTGTNPYYGGQDLLINGRSGSPWRGDSGGPVTSNGVLYGALSWGTSQGTNARAQAGYGSLIPHVAWVQKMTGIAPNSGGGVGGGKPAPSPDQGKNPTPAPSGEAAKHFDATSWNQIAQASNSHPVAVEVGATWCGACQQLKPRMEAAFKSSGGKWSLAAVDADRSPQLARQIGASAYPTVAFYWRGREVPGTRWVGAVGDDKIQSVAAKAVQYAQANGGSQPAPSPKPVPSPDPKPAPSPDPTSSLRTLTDKNFDEFMAESKGKTIFLDFSKDGCEPCAALHPVLEEQGRKWGSKTVIGVLDGTAYPKLWAQYQNPWFPTVIAIRDGKELGRHSGYANDKAEMVSWMEKAMQGTATSDPRVFDATIYTWNKVEEMSWRHPVIVAYYRTDGKCPTCDKNIATLKEMVAQDGGKWTLVTVNLNDIRTQNIWDYFHVKFSDTIDTYYRDDLVQDRLLKAQTTEQLKAHINKTLSTHYPPKAR